MIRVLHFIPAFGMGGVESLIMSYYRAIDKNKVQFDFLVETEEKRKEFEEIESLGGKVYKLQKLNKKNPFSYICEVKEFFKRYASDVDVVHCHHIERATVVLYYAKKHKIQLRIIHAHTDSIIDVRFRRIRQTFMRINNRLSTHWFACSQAAGKFQFAKDKKPFYVLKNAINSDMFKYRMQQRNISRETFGFSQETVVLGHTGRFTYAKNHWKIIDVFYEMQKNEPSAHLLLVGDGPLKKEMEKKVIELGIENLVSFTGARDDISYLLQAMDIFILPSFYEGFCISLLEAQCSGLLCICSNVIPKEVEMTHEILKLSLENSNDIWAEHILSILPYKRESKHDVIIKNGYDIVENSRWLMDFYLRNTIGSRGQ